MSLSPTDYVCGPLPIVTGLGVFVPPKDPKKDEDTIHYIPQDPKAWLSHSNISYTFLDAGDKIHDWQVHLVEDAIAEYARYANVNLTRTSKDQDPSAGIRISFNRDGGAWSAIGTDALKIVNGPTMNLGFLSALEVKKLDDLGDRETLYSLTLHQFGHAFGLAHEWEWRWAMLQDGNNEAIKQHIAAFQFLDENKYFSTSNFEKPDEKSIMRFIAPANYIQKGQLSALPPNKALSHNDKSWLTLFYPGKAGGANEDTGILHALSVLSIPLEESSQILLGSTVSEMRFHYHQYISKKWGDRLGAKAVMEAISALKANKQHVESSQSHVLQGKISGITPLVDHDSEDDLYDAVAAAVLDPQFSVILANAVKQDNDGQPDVQNFVYQPGLPYGWMAGINHQAPPDVQNFLGPIINVVGGLLGQLLLSGLPANAAPEMYPQALPPNVEQGIFNTLAKFLKHPTFLGIIRDVADDMLKQHGLVKPDQSRETKREPLQ